MCGIFGIITTQYSSTSTSSSAIQLNDVIRGLENLQNRGYDSAGMSIKYSDTDSISGSMVTYKFAAAVVDNDNTEFLTAVFPEEDSPIDKLKRVANLSSRGHIQNVIAHNRWATHGANTNANAHPHTSNTGMFTIVHNGIIDNYAELKQFLLNKGYTFLSDTDTEVIVNLIEYEYTNSPVTLTAVEAIESAIRKLSGTYAMIIQPRKDNMLYCAVKNMPLLLAVGHDDDTLYVTSEESGLRGFPVKNDEYYRIANDDLIVIGATMQSATTAETLMGFYSTRGHIYNNTTSCQLSCAATATTTTTATTAADAAEHHTLREIYEQEQIINNKFCQSYCEIPPEMAASDICVFDNSSADDAEPTEAFLNCVKNVENVLFIGCGTSYYAAEYAEQLFKYSHGLRLNVVKACDAAKFSPKHDIPKISDTHKIRTSAADTLVIFLSQSGETRDVLACIPDKQLYKKFHAATFCIVNVENSTLDRSTDFSIHCSAGTEVGVASTKSFTAQILCLHDLLNVFISIKSQREICNLPVISLPGVFDAWNTTMKKWASIIHRGYITSVSGSANSMFLLGRGLDEYIAKEGALKIKELALMHAEGYCVSSLKHGPFALLSAGFPVIMVHTTSTEVECNSSAHNHLMFNCLQELLARNASVFYITTPAIAAELRAIFSIDGSTAATSGGAIGKILEILEIPESEMYNSMMAAIPLQLLAYHLAILRGINPDRPRNLAKVVTVE